MTHLYRASATVGGPHPGEVRSSDGALRAPLAVPPEMGGRGGGTNPEQLLAAAYAACFYTALEEAANEAQLALPADLAVTCEVALGRRDGGFELAVDLDVPQADGKLQELADRARELWPHAPGVAPAVRLRAAASA